MHIYLPLVRSPSEEELAKIRYQDPTAELITHDFSVRAKYPKSLTELLTDKLQPDLLASLPHSADVIGDIVVIELPPELEPHQKTIGEAILKMYKNSRTVLAKASAITGDYRLRDYQVIAGEAKTETVHKEHGCLLHVDLSKAYFSPRLSHEHNRIALAVKEGETVIDMFAGVGSFAVLIGKKHENVKVYAIDVNPNAVSLLRTNARVNRVETKVFPVLGDAREIVQQRLAGMADRVIMNLPEKSFDYVDVACKALKTKGGNIHFYSFTRPKETIESIRERLQKSISENARQLVKISFSGLVRATGPHEWQAVIDAQIH